MPNKTHTLRPPSARDNSRLKAMNRQLYPAILKTLPSGAIQFNYRKNGKVIRVVVGHDLESAYERAVLMRRDVDALPVVSQRKVSLGQWYDEWSSTHYADLSPTTVDGYGYCWRSVSERLKQAELADLTAEFIKTELDLITKESMKNHAAVFLSVVMNAAVKKGLLIRSPFSVGYKKHKKLVNILSADQLIKLFECASESLRPALALAAFCGLRRGEIMALTAGDIDLRQKLVYIRRARIKTSGPDAVEAIKSTKTGEPRIVPVPDVAIPYLAYIQDKPTDELIYPTFRSDISARLKTACKKANLPRLAFHDLRHICGSNLMMMGGVALAQAVLGHTDIKTTVDTYGHLSSAYLISQVNRAHLSEDFLTEFLRQAREFQADSDPKLAAFATDAEQICQYLSMGEKKGLSKTS